MLATTASPALAQTDDRILNDVVKVVAGSASVTAMARLCAEVTGGDATVAAAFAGFKSRSTAYLVIGTLLIGQRGGMDTGILTDATAAEAEKIEAAFAGDPDPARSCRTFAGTLDDQQVDLGQMFPAETRRIGEARDGKWPVLDVEKSWQVQAAIEMKEHFMMREALLTHCGEIMGDARLYGDAFSYWRSRNYDVWAEANRILENWGALDPRRMIEARERAISEGEFRATPERCTSFAANVEDGGEDMSEVEELLTSQVNFYAEIIP